MKKNTFLIVGIIILCVFGFFIYYQKSIKATSSGSGIFSISLRTGTEDVIGQNILSKLNRVGGIKSASYFSSADQLAQFKEKHSDNKLVNDMINSVDSQPFQPLIKGTVVSGIDSKELSQKIFALDKTDIESITFNIDGRQYVYSP